ncbi:MAG: type IV conjugative transfer system coupling protein TraD [Woeseia sp.]|nr:type IV conjugative transfer system coupling protein TraD [Woeseia sp.]
MFDNRLRPVFEFLPASVAMLSALALLVFPQDLFPIMPLLAWIVAALLGAWGLCRFLQGAAVIRYQTQLRQLPRYRLAPRQIPTSNSQLFLGLGFRWSQRHTQRLVEARHPDAIRYLQHGLLFRGVRRLEQILDGTAGLRWLARMLRANAWWNPFRPLPAVGGDPLLHGVGAAEEAPVTMNLDERNGHTLVVGTTRVGKTREAEILVTQDIRRGETVVVIDPKGDSDLLMRCYAEAKRAGRLNTFQIIHLGFPEWSARYNPVGDFGRITEVASRTATQLPSAGNSAAFREFAWRFTNVVARALVGLGRRPDYRAIARHVTNIEPLLIDYYEWWLNKIMPGDWRDAVQTIESNIEPKNLTLSHRGRDHYALGLIRFANECGLYDPVADGLRSAFDYDKTYFDKLTASLLPLLEKLTSGAVGELLAPRYADLNDDRPILDWMRVIRENGIVYVGLDALSDPEVASAVGNSMFADLTSVAGRLYKHGDTQGLPQTLSHRRAPCVVHADEFAELVGQEFIPLLNKAGGAGIQVTAYTQTTSDIEAGIGDRAKAGQILGNFNTLLMLRVRNEHTARVLTEHLPRVRVFTKTAESRVTDNNEPDTPVDFISQNADRLMETDTEMLMPADVMALPKGQCFALLHGGHLFKLRMPLPGKDSCMPSGLDEIRTERLLRYAGCEP